MGFPRWRRQDRAAATNIRIGRATKPILKPCLILALARVNAIDAAFEVDEVKDIRDKAIAMEAYFKQAKNTEAERRACEIRLRAERKAGQLRKQEQKNKGGRPSKKLSPIGGAGFDK